MGIEKICRFIPCYVRLIQFSMKDTQNFTERAMPRITEFCCCLGCFVILIMRRLRFSEHKNPIFIQIRLHRHCDESQFDSSHEQFNEPSRRTSIYFGFAHFPLIARIIMMAPISGELISRRSTSHFAGTDSKAQPVFAMVIDAQHFRINVAMRYRFHCCPLFCAPATDTLAPMQPVATVCSNRF